MTRLNWQPGRRIGLLGGSFNPAHEGHLHISLIALRRLELDQVWWLVSPQNPLKETSDTAPLEERIAQAEQVAGDPRIVVTGLEQDLGTQYTVDTIAALKGQAPTLRFVWLMGADNLIQLPHWKSWRQIFEQVPIAVIARPGYTIPARSSKAAQIYAKAQLDSDDAALLPGRPTPAWTFIQESLHPASSTEIRSKQPINTGDA